MGIAGCACYCPSKTSISSHCFQGDRRPLEKIYLGVTQYNYKKTRVSDAKGQENGQQEWWWIEGNEVEENTLIWCRNMSRLLNKIGQELHALLCLKSPFCSLIQTAIWK